MSRADSESTGFGSLAWPARHAEVGRLETLARNLPWPVSGPLGASVQYSGRMGTGREQKVAFW